MEHCSRSLPRLLLAGVAVLASPRMVAGQAAPARLQATKPWHAIGSVSVQERANNNVFLLSDATKGRLDTLTMAAPPGTRFASMQSANDYITSVEAGLGIEGSGFFGRALSIRSELAYDYYALNAKRRNADLGLSISQEFPFHGRLQLRGRLVPSYFYRDFMADATDLNGDGVIESSERIYAAGTYRDGGLSVGYRQRLLRSTHPFGAAVELEVGQSVRTYQAPFSYRSYRGPLVRAGLALGLNRLLALDVGYTHASLRSTPDTAVLLLNEPDFNQDFNGDGTATDQRVRSVQMVDFSRLEQDLDVGLRADLSTAVTARLQYEHRWRRFPSAQPYDVLNNSRRDHRDLMGAELSFRVTPNARLSIGGDVETQKVSRSLVPSVTGEVTDYSRNRIYAGWRFHI